MSEYFPDGEIVDDKFLEVGVRKLIDEERFKEVCPQCNYKTINTFNSITKEMQCLSCYARWYSDTPNEVAFRERVAKALIDDYRKIPQSKIDWEGTVPTMWRQELLSLRQEMAELKKAVADPLYELRRRVESFEMK